MFETKVTKLFEIEHPIIQGGMQWVARAELAAAVSNAGGLGILSALTFPHPEELAAEIKKTRKITNMPFGVNLSIKPTLRPVDYDGYIDIIIKEGIKIVETAGRNPEAYINRLKSSDIKIIHKCPAVRFARTAERVGCDAISIDGFECAGHPGEDDVTSLILIPLTVDAVKIPVIASGGFSDARGFLAALALGAEGVTMGTRFLATQEAPIHPKLKESLIRASERDTMLILRSFRNTERALKGLVATKVAKMEEQGATIKELAHLISGKSGKEVLETGELDRGILSVGQTIGLIRNIPTVKEIIDSIINEAREIITGRLHKFITS